MIELIIFILNNGMVSFKGFTNEAIKFYLNDNIISNQGEIKDAIVKIKDYITIKDILINGSTKNQISIPSNDSFLDLEIIGYTNEQINIEVKLYIKDQNGSPMAGLVEGRYKGISTKITKGEFNIKKKIKLPHFVSNGNYYIDLYLHQPLIQDYFYAPHCADLHFEGNFEGFGKPLIGRTDGFFGLETV